MERETETTEAGAEARAATAYRPPSETDELAFCLGARGWCVAELQQALGLRADGRFGPRTYEAVTQLQHRIGRTPDGRADRHLFEAIDLCWPSEFDRILALVSELEGTSFGDCNPTDIDGAGLTFGLCGFTTRDGEVQALLETFLRRAPEAWTWAEPRLQRRLRRLIETSASHDEWERELLDAGRRPRPELRAALAAWGQHPTMQSLQRSWAYERFWKPACRRAQALGVDSARGRSLLFDVWVQNGGWRPAHDQRLKRLLSARANPAMIPLATRLEAIALAVAAEARQPWRADVLSRKLLFARGAALVHGVMYDLAAQAIDTP